MPCTRPLLAARLEWLDRNTGAVESRVHLQGLYTDARAARAAKPAAKWTAADKYNKWQTLKLPCGKCLDCQQRSKLHWVLRCQQEATQHKSVLFTTLTYEDAPWTLAVDELQRFHKRLRKAIAQQKVQVDGLLRPRRYRHFSCGEYGETNGRPHYHAILFGLEPRDEEAIQKAWGLGFTTTERAGPGAIAYVAGYVNKKAELQTSDQEGWQNPFIVMSRGGKDGFGIGGHAKKWRDSWRTHAVLGGNKIAVPRYYHEAWKKDATDEELEELALDRETYFKHHGEETDSQRLARSLATATRLSHKRAQRRQNNKRL